MNFTNINQEDKLKIFKILKIVLIVLIAVSVINLFFDDRSNRYGDNTKNTITFSGHGEVSAIPDIANVSFTIRKEAKTVKVAQEGVAKIEKDVLDMLKANNVEDKDIKATNASFNPKYEYVYQKQVMPCTQYGCPPNPGKNVITGYEAYETISLKIRNADDTGKIIQELGALGVSELSGPNFTIDKEDELKIEARKKAILDAKEKAKILAKDLGVRLGKITSFSESDNYPVPMYSKGMMDMAVSSSAPAVIPKGENTISSNVSITYELR
jgi:uncharacterized protein YggE